MNSMSEDWKNLPIGAWFFCDSPNCTDRYSVQERTSGGYSIVCSTPFHHEPAKRDMKEIAKRHNQVTQAAPVSPDVNAEMLELLDWLDRKGGLGLDVHDRITAVLQKAKAVTLTPSNSAKETE